MLRCPLVVGLLVVMCVGTALAQGVKVEYYPCDPESAIDLQSPQLQAVMLEIGFVPDTAAEEPKVLSSLLEQMSAKPPTPLAFAVRLTNSSSAAIPLKSENLVAQEGKWGAAGADFAKPAKELKASAQMTSFAGAKSLFAKGESLAAGKSAVGVVYFEAAEESDAPQRVTYAGGSVSVDSVSRSLAVLDAAGVKMTDKGGSSAPPPPSGSKPKILGAAGNTDDGTPMSPGKPGAIVWAAKTVDASPNIATEQTMSSGAGGGMMGGMGGGGMGGGMMGGGMMGPGMMGGQGGGGMMGPGMMMGPGGGQGVKPAGGAMPGMPGGAAGAKKPTRPRKPAAE